VLCLQGVGVVSREDVQAQIGALIGLVQRLDEHITALEKHNRDHCPRCREATSIKVQNAVIARQEAEAASSRAALEERALKAQWLKIELSGRPAPAAWRSPTDWTAPGRISVNISQTANGKDSFVVDRKNGPFYQAVRTAEWEKLLQRVPDLAAMTSDGVLSVAPLPIDEAMRLEQKGA
jgi:hypothetical protein